MYFKPKIKNSFYFQEQHARDRVLSPIDVNLAFYHECRSLIGYATHYLFKQQSQRKVSGAH